VTAIDPEGVEHGVEVTAESLYEAVALAICAVRKNDETNRAVGRISG
jgi:hypothetical protein